MSATRKSYRTVGLFVPCMVDQFLPEVGEATVRVLRALGLTVTYDDRQTCCGQPAFNAGHVQPAAHLARRALAIFGDSSADAIVAPSGSCVAMLRIHAGELLSDPAERATWDTVRGKLFELTEFLAGPLGLEAIDGRYRRRVAYHESCHLARELGVRESPVRLLRSIDGLELTTLKDADVCCGFGGTFSAKQPELSIAIGEDKAARVLDSGADELVVGDAGCLLQIRGVLRGSQAAGVPVRHIAELLADALEAHRHGV